MAAAASLADAIQRSHSQKVEPVCLLESSLQALLIDGFGKIKERAGDGGDGNGVAYGAVIWVDSPAM